MTVDEMAARLTPSPGPRSSKKSDVVRLTLGLPRPGHGVEPGEAEPGEAEPGGAECGGAQPWLTQGAIAQRLGITQASVSRHHQAAIKEWAAEQWLVHVRNELVELVAAAGRVMTAHELAAALRVHHACFRGTAGDAAQQEAPNHTMAKASAVVRAAVEAETWPDAHDGAAVDIESRLAVRRRGQHVLIVLESLPGTRRPQRPGAGRLRLRLGRKADELADGDPLPGQAVVLRDLRAVTAPEGLATLADTRLVALAAAASDQAAASPRLELYPRALDLTRALRISQAAAGVLREGAGVLREGGARQDGGITMAELLIKVRARFPDLVLDEQLTHVQVEEALRAAGFALEYEPADKRFRPPAPELGRGPTSSSTAMSGHGRMAAAGLDPHAITARKLAATVTRGGFLALPLRGLHLPGTAQALASAYSVTPVDLNREFLVEFRTLAAERGQDWGKVLSIDARFTETGQLSPGMASYLRAVWARVEQRLFRLAAEPATVLFLHDAGLVTRYYDQGGHDVLTRLQHAARRPADAPHGCWLLCPAESALDTPNLDGRIVEVLDESERVVLSGAFLASLRGEAGTAA